MRASDDLSRARVEAFCHGRFECRCPPDHGTETGHSREVIDDLVARRWCAFLKGHLLLCVDDWYDANLARIRYIELTAGEPLIEEPSPSSERSRRRCPHKLGDCVGLHSFEEGC